MKRLIPLLVVFACLPVIASDANGARLQGEYLPQIVKVSNEEEVDSLQSEGVEVIRRRGDILLCLLPNKATRSGIDHRILRPVTPALDAAAEFYGASSIRSGAAVGTPYTGKGVVVGLCDIGFDPLHPAFLDADGRSRVKRVVQYVESEGIRIELEGDDAYRQWTTDNPDKYHATHVCGILAGNGAGTPYVGMAPDAEIVATVSTLSEVGLLAGVEDVIDYAKEVGRPAVVNISVGSYTGAHDGSSLFSQYLDMCAEDAVIVLSAGNEGSHLNFLSSDFTPDRQSIAFRLGNKTWDQFDMYGITDLWSGSAAPLTVRLGAYDTNEQCVAAWLAPVRPEGGESVEYVWRGEHEAFPFEGELTVIGDLDPENGRHRTSLVYDFTAKEVSDKGPWARYMLAVEVAGQPGDDVEVYADGIYTRLTAHTGNPAPSSSRSVSDLACGFNVISVGMYGNRDSVPRDHPGAFGDDMSYMEATGYDPGAPVRHSSYGTLRDGRVTPLTVAPGADLMSAASRPFLEANPLQPHQRLGGSVWIDEGGTSMAAPYVAGCIATWLEAVPSLTAADVRHIMASTNRLDFPASDDPHIGAGYFDPVAGLRLAVQGAGVEAVESPFGPVQADSFIEVFDASGIKRYAGAASELSGIGSGLYLVKTPWGVFKRIIR